MHKAELGLLVRGGQFIPPRVCLQLSLGSGPHIAQSAGAFVSTRGKCLGRGEERKGRGVAEGGGAGEARGPEQVIDAPCTREQGIKWEKM